MAVQFLTRNKKSSLPKVHCIRDIYAVQFQACNPQRKLEQRGRHEVQTYNLKTCAFVKQWEMFFFQFKNHAMFSREKAPKKTKAIQWMGRCSKRPLPIHTRHHSLREFRVFHPRGSFPVRWRKPFRCFVGKVRKRTTSVGPPLGTTSFSCFFLVLPRAEKCTLINVQKLGMLFSIFYLRTVNNSLMLLFSSSRGRFEQSLKVSLLSPPWRRRRGEESIWHHAFLNFCSELNGPMTSPLHLGAGGPRNRDRSPGNIKAFRDIRTN